MRKVIFNKIKFININEKEALKIINKKGLFVFPAAPPLATLKLGSLYHKALIKSDFVFFDSGFFVLLLKLLKDIKVEKFSGFRFLNIFFKSIKKKKNKILLIDPSERVSRVNKKFLKNLGIKKIHSYIAPFYDVKNIKDKLLLKTIREKKPKYILINIGGGTQEVLGMYIKYKLKNKISIICTGAAISFFTKEQAPINQIIDNLYLGWLIRLLFNPKIFLKRYLSAFKLVSFVKKSNVKIVK
ncbi:MAG: WecB/TagA/CpsF family glycosyltransferase [Candidatus Pelagibacter sp.]|tara:strand:- start:2630 stop:3355 length:726 start_codon:yes stop_codon:yes gene_type:complete